MELRPLGEGAYALYKEALPIGRACYRGGRFWEFFVEEAWRRRGYGTWFFKQVLKAEGVPPALPLTAAPPQGQAGRAFLAKLGFSPAAGQWCRAPAPQENALTVVHAFWRARLRPGGFALDATAGNGRDTALLCRLVGPAGRVLALDIQQRAVDATNARLAAEGLAGVGRAVLDSHANLVRYAAPGTADAVVFNLGYLPGASHRLFTVPQVSVPALGTALGLLRPGGILTVCAYSGGAQGTAERDAVLAWADGLDRARFAVKQQRFEERAGHPPVALCLRRRA